MASDAHGSHPGKELSSVCKRFVDQVVVITGGAQGLGYGVAERFVTEGAHVIILDVNEDSAHKAAQAIHLSEGGKELASWSCDVGSEESVSKVFHEIFTRFHKVDVLVQSAGIVGQTNTNTEHLDANSYDNVMRVNAKGIFLCAKAVLPGMVSRNYGRIVNIASVAGKEGNAGMMPYSASKAAVIGMTKSMGKEYAETGITINCICPGVIRTPMVAAMPSEQVKYMTDKIPMKRTAAIREIAAQIAYVASSEASFTTGFAFDCSGGRATY